VSVQTALAFGATSVVVSDVNPARLQLALELGATEVVDARSDSVLDLPRPPEVLLECSASHRRSVRASGRWPVPAVPCSSAWAATRSPCRCRSSRSASSS
jgi:threonine dehydrogenase-like Zn-dependent dehydrogenase